MTDSVASAHVLHLGDCVEVLRDLPDASVDAVVSDPPYELGFMGKGWDASGIAYSVALWRDVLRVLKPGGHLLAFGGTRTYHRLACAIEDAGFEIRDSISWVYGSGFPKSLDVSKAIDKAAGAERKVVGSREVWDRGVDRFSDIGEDVPVEGNAVIPVTAPATDDAARWQGWGTALKPAHEPIVVARKPLAGTVAQTVLAHGTGALNIDGCRVAGPKGDGVWGTSNKNRNPNEAVRFNASPGREDFRSQQHDAGRWPPNFVLTHAEGCGEACVEGCPAAFDESRFFPTFRYQAKASRRERNAGLEGMPEKQSAKYADGDGLAGRTMVAGEWQNTDAERKPAANHHPTVKPVELMRWLCRLVTPPGGVVLDPFTGSGTTGVAAVLEGFDFIGIEREPEYAEIAERRISWWAQSVKPTLFQEGE